jgi:hypothetical protein
MELKEPKEARCSVCGISLGLPVCPDCLQRQLGTMDNATATRHLRDLQKRLSHELLGMGMKMKRLGSEA